MKIFRPYTFYALFLALLSYTTASEYRVTFRVQSDSLGPGDIIYITGNVAELGEWNPGKIAMTQETDGVWSTTLYFAEQSEIEYKFTRGSWETEAVNDMGVEFSNFTLQVIKDTTISRNLPHWRDRFLGEIFISADRFARKAGQIELLKNWKYRFGDDTVWTEIDYDDSDWEKVDTRLRADDLPAGDWKGYGWFRLHLSIDSSLWNKTLGVRIFQGGASEIFLNGERIYNLGRFATASTEVQQYAERNPKQITFRAQSDQVIAVRYANFNVKEMNQFGLMPGFFITLYSNIEDVIARRVYTVRLFSVYQILFTVVPLVFAFVHLMLFMFYPIAKENLYYAICLLGWSLISFLNFLAPFISDLMIFILFAKLSPFIISVALISGLFTAYQSIYKRLPRRYLFFVAAAVLQSIWGPIDTDTVLNYFVIVFVAVTGLETFRVFLIPGKGKVKSSRIIGFGFGALLFSLVIQVLMSLNIVEPIGQIPIFYTYGVLILSITVSIDLSRTYAQTNRNLQLQIEKIHDLSRITLEQERLAKENEIKRRILEADNDRKTRELEEARKLQLSMLPSEIPESDDLEIAVYMKTASEVGGDYYDFYTDTDSSLTVALGDATGHGIKAGIMVALTKSLFNALGNTFYIPDFFEHSTRMIKKMHLGNLFMALMLLRIKNRKITVSAAGMPPVYLYRKITGSIEEVTIKGIPLGAVTNFSYGQEQRELQDGDTVLLLSDGFIELFNSESEIMDFARVKSLFLKSADKAPAEIISDLTKAGEEWRGERPQNDDITFVVIKVKTNTV